MNTIRSLIKGTFPKNAHLKNILKKIINVLRYFPQVSIHHIMRENNSLEDTQANLATMKEKGDVRINGRLSHHPIP
jgi:hypothetical protein